MSDTDDLFQVIGNPAVDYLADMPCSRCRLPIGMVPHIELAEWGPADDDDNHGSINRLMLHIECAKKTAWDILRRAGGHEHSTRDSQRYRNGE